MKIALSAESTVDLSKDLLEKYNVKILPYTITLGEEDKLDGTFSTQEIFDFVKTTKILPKTSAINEFQFEEHFNSLLQDHDAVIHISLSGKITSATTNAINVSKRMDNVYVIDSQSLSTGIGLLVIYAGKLIEKGLEPKEIVAKVEERIPYVQASFIVERLDYLHKGGRCSSIQLLGANILKLRPQILVKDGKMETGKKYRGPMEAVIRNYCNDIFKDFSNPDKEEVFITYSSATDGMIESAKKVLIENGFTNIHCTTAGCTITSHCGENTLGVLFINDGGNK